MNCPFTGPCWGLWFIDVIVNFTLLRWSGLRLWGLYKRGCLWVVVAGIILLDIWGQEKGQAIGRSHRASCIIATEALVTPATLAQSKVLFFQDIRWSSKKNEECWDNTQRICSLYIYLDPKCIYVCVCVYSYIHIYVDIHLYVCIFNHSTFLYSVQFVSKPSS